MSRDTTVIAFRQPEAIDDPRKLRRWLRDKYQRRHRAFWRTPRAFWQKAGLYILEGRTHRVRK